MLRYVLKVSTAGLNKFKTIYWYGERYYCAEEVDAHLNATNSNSNSSKNVDTTVHVVEVAAISSTASASPNHDILAAKASEYWTATASEGTLALSASVSAVSSPARSPSKSTIARSEPADSPHSVTSGASTSGGGGAGVASRGRAIGKRNQEFYLPDGGVRLSHISIGLGSGSGCDGGSEENTHEWFGRYDKQSNTIIRTSDSNTDTTDTAIATYETLAHFAQEHDREIHQSDYKDTPNVWKNHLFKFYNTVTCNWEPLSNLRE